MKNNHIGTSHMYPNENYQLKHHVPKSTNNNQPKIYRACMKRSEIQA